MTTEPLSLYTQNNPKNYFFNRIRETLGEPSPRLRELRELLERTRQALYAADVAVSNARADRRLSATGQGERITLAATDQMGVIAKVTDRLNKLQAGVMSDKAALLKLKRLDPSDAVTALRHSELRSWFRGLPEAARMAAIARMRTGDPAIGELTNAILLDGGLTGLVLKETADAIHVSNLPEDERDRLRVLMQEEEGIEVVHRGVDTARGGIKSVSGLTYDAEKEAAEAAREQAEKDAAEADRAAAEERLKAEFLASLTPHIKRDAAA